MSIQGLNNGSLFNLGSIRSLAGSGSGSSSSSGGSFSLGGGSSSGSMGPASNDISSVGQGNLGLGTVPSNSPDVSNALNSVAGDSALSAQFQSQLALVNLQERVQNQSRTVEILTNVLKSRHDAALDAIRNVK